MERPRKYMSHKGVFNNWSYFKNMFIFGNEIMSSFYSHSIFDFLLWEKEKKRKKNLFSATKQP